MAALYDNSQRGFTTTPATSFSTAAAAVAGTNRVLFAWILTGATTVLDPSTVKWNTTESLTQLGTTINLGANVKISLWRLINPTAGSFALDVTWAGTQEEIGVIWVSTKDTDQVTPNGTVATATGSTSAPTVNASSAAGELVLDGAGFSDNGANNITLTVDASQTSNQEIDGADLGFEGLGSSRETAAGASTTMSWTMSATAAFGWGIFAFQVNGAAAGGETPPYNPGRMPKIKFVG